LINILVNDINYVSIKGSITFSELELVDNGSEEPTDDSKFADFTMQFSGQFGQIDDPDTDEIAVSGTIKITNLGSRF
jgi:hypothetical protein